MIENKNIKLFIKTGCPYCAKVENILQELQIDYEEKNVSIDKESESELLKMGGEFQAPFLVDEKNKISMYESDDIIRYLKEHAKSGKIVCHTEHCRHEEKV